MEKDLKVYGYARTTLVDYDDVLTSAEVKQILKIGRTKLYELLAKGDIQSIRVGTEYRIPKTAVLEYIYII